MSVNKVPEPAFTQHVAGQDANSLGGACPWPGTNSLPLSTAELFQRDTSSARGAFKKSPAPKKGISTYCLLWIGSLKGQPRGVVLHSGMQCSLRDTCNTHLFAKGKAALGFNRLGKSLGGFWAKHAVLQKEQTGVQNAYFKLTRTEK